MLKLRWVHFKVYAKCSNFILEVQAQSLHWKLSLKMWIGKLLNTSRITLKCSFMRFGWLTPRRFFNYPYPYGRIGQPCGLGLSVTMCFKTLLRQTKILSNNLLCVSDIPRNKYVSGSIKNQRKAKQSTSLFLIRRQEDCFVYQTVNQ